MKNAKTKSSKKSARKQPAGSPGKTKPGAVKSLHDLFSDELKDIYWAEKALTKAIPKMIKNAASEALSDALTKHLDTTEEHVKRLEEVFSLINEKAAAKKCEAMAGLIKEAEEIMLETEKGAVRDAGIISAGQKVEHYEIATYGTLLSFARTLGEEDAAALLLETLNEEKEADEKLTEIAEASVNIQAAGEEGEEEDNDTGALKKRELSTINL